MRRLLALLVLLLPIGSAFAQSVVKTDNVRAELISEVSEVKAGEPFWVALRETIRPHWHTYWKSWGHSGLPTEITWTLPPGVKADPIVWPTPTLIDVSGVTNYGFQDDILLLMKITPPADLAGSALTLAASANGLVGADVCVPEEGKFTLTLPVGPTAKPANSATRALFDQARRIVPMESPWPARFGIAKSGDPTLIVEAKGLKPDMIRGVYFFPAEWGAVASMAKQAASVTSEGIRIPLRKGDAKGGPPSQLGGTLVLTEKTGDGEHRQAFDVIAKVDPAFVPAGTPLAAAGGEELSFVEALLFALLGGLILNLMPCVFPVLAMKAAAFARLAGHEKSAMRRDGIAYTAGGLVSFAIMALAGLAPPARARGGERGGPLSPPGLSPLVRYLFFVGGLLLPPMV